jgi:hypothetical protein
LSFSRRSSHEHACRCSQLDVTGIEGIAELVAPLTGVIRREFDKLCRSEIPALDGRSPLELIAAGEIARVQRLVSGLEDPRAV